MNKAKQDIVNSVILLALCGFAYYESLLIPPPVLGKTGAAFFPKIVIAILAVLSVALLISGFYRLMKQSRPSQSDSVKRTPYSFRQWLINNKKILYTFLIFAVYISLLNLIGYIVSTLLFLLALYLLLAQKRTKVIYVSIGIVVVTFLIYFIFEDLLSIFLPSGIWL